MSICEDIHCPACYSVSGDHATYEIVPKYTCGTIWCVGECITGEAGNRLQCCYLCRKRGRCDEYALVYKGSGLEGIMRTRAIRKHIRRYYRDNEYM
jgi:hypothetical protein